MQENKYPFKTYIDREKWIKDLEKKVTEKDPEAMKLLGDVYRFGVGSFPKDINEALKLYKMAVSNGSTEAASRLAMMYEYGDEGIPVDINEAAKYYEIAVIGGDTHSALKLAEIYREGKGNVEQDINKAVRYYSIAAAKGEPFSTFRLATMYRTGFGVKKDTAISATMFFKLLDNTIMAKSSEESLKSMIKNKEIEIAILNTLKDGLEKSNILMFHYANILLEEGDEMDKIRAVKYLKLLANSGHAKAMIKFGKMLIDGDHVPKNITKGRQYFNKAISLGIQDLLKIKRDDITDANNELDSFCRIRQQSTVIGNGK